MTWLYRHEAVLGIPDGYEGFVYQITRMSDGKSYIGKKGFWKAVVKKPLSGKTRKRHSKVESDWVDYFGSNDVLKTEVQMEGRDGFRRDILHLCSSKSEMTYFETKEIFARDAIISDQYYNSWVVAKVSRNQLPNLLR